MTTMLLARRTAAAAALAALSALGRASGHGQMTVPAVRPDTNGFAESFEQRRPTHTLNGPLFGYGAKGFRCRELGPTGGAPATTLVAGQEFDVAWKMEAPHPGDCYLYVSYDEDVSDPVNWFKIAALPGCGAADGLNIPDTTTRVMLPAELPACDHCVLRWEWTAHQQVSDIEFYVQCADIAITSGAAATRPSPMVAISGVEHLPSSASAYRKVYQGEGPEPKYLVGPAVATYAPCIPGSAGCVGSSGVLSAATLATSARAPAALCALALLAAALPGH